MIQANTDFEVRSLNEEFKLEVQKNVHWSFYIKYLFIGIFFGIVLVKSEAISWFRIQEMFRLQSFHMFGTIGSAVITGLISVQLLKRMNINSLNGEKIKFPQIKFNKGQILGGLLFGFGWALTGACPGPMFALVGSGQLVFLIVLVSAIAGTFIYGAIRERLPH